MVRREGIVTKDVLEEDGELHVDALLLVLILLERLRRDIDEGPERIGR